MNAAPIIDVNADVRIPQSANKFDETKHKYKCSCCGKGFIVQNGNFQKVMMFYFRPIMDIYRGAKLAQILM